MSSKKYSFTPERVIIIIMSIMIAESRHFDIIETMSGDVGMDRYLILNKNVIIASLPNCAYLPQHHARI
jgi:hypothetical protein